MRRKEIRSKKQSEPKAVEYRIRPEQVACETSVHPAWWSKLAWRGGHWFYSFYWVGGGPISKFEFLICYASQNELLNATKWCIDLIGLLHIMISQFWESVLPIDFSSESKSRFLLRYATKPYDRRGAYGVLLQVAKIESDGVRFLSIFEPFHSQICLCRSAICNKLLWSTRSCRFCCMSHEAGHSISFMFEVWSAMGNKFPWIPRTQYEVSLYIIYHFPQDS